MDKIKNMIPKEHQLKCCNCAQIIDKRDLSQVFAHEVCNGPIYDEDEIKKISYSSSKKVGDSILWIKDKKPIVLN